MNLGSLEVGCLGWCNEHRDKGWLFGLRRQPLSCHMTMHGPDEAAQATSMVAYQLVRTFVVVVSSKALAGSRFVLMLLLIKTVGLLLMPMSAYTQQLVIPLFLGSISEPA